MDKLISQLIASGANLQDIDLAELQVSGEAFSRKLTGLQLRGVEKLERETQDNVIEAASGLDPTGVFVSPANSWYIRPVDFAAGCTDRGGATGALSENIVNGLRLLDAKITTLATGVPVVLFSNVVADATLTNVIPAGYMLEYVIFNEKAGGSPILDLGTTVGGNDVFINQVIALSDLTTVFVPRIFSLVGATTLYLNATDPGSTWGGGTVDVYFVMKQIV